MHFALFVCCVFFALAGMVFADDREIDDKLLIHEVQLKLYELGWLQGMPDGIVGEDTTRAITRFQEQQHDMRVNGRLTYDVLHRLRSIPPLAGAMWGAMSVDADGRYTVTFGRRTRRNAEDYVLEHCMERSLIPETCRAFFVRKDHVWHEPGWLVGITCRNSKSVDSEWGATPDAAYQNAHARIKKSGKRAKDCRPMTTAVTADRSEMPRH